MRPIPRSNNGATAAATTELDYRQLFESAPGQYLVLTPELNIADASEAYLRATMTRREDVVGHNLYDVFPDNPDSSDHSGSRELAASLQRVLRDREPDFLPVQRYDIRRPANAGGGFEVRYWSPCNLPILHSDGRLRCILHCVEDVTSFVRLLHEQPGESGDFAASTEMGHFAMARLARGLERHVAERTAELAAANEKLAHELEERQRLEEQFRQAQKMEAVGRLAGGVAHDFNNLLTVIQGYGEALLAGESDQRRRHKLEQMLRASDRAAGLTRQLLAFSRQQILQPRVLDLNNVVADTSAMLRRVIGEDVELATALAPDLGNVKADAGQLEQVLMNLAVNARDAKPSGGRLTIETANVELDAAFGSRRGFTVQPGPHVMLAVTDTGVGMSAATRQRIFEPFFTTKDVHRGTGLGLAMVYGVVRQSGGSIWVYSEPGQGACFKIYLPRVDENAEPSECPLPAAAARGGAETVLLVEDEEDLRELVRSTLEEHGYQVLAASGRDQALQLLGDAANPVDLLLTDLVMAGKNGRELGEEVRSQLPATKIVYMSGYTDDVVVRRGVIEAGMPFLQKPFRPADLLCKLRRVLDGGD